MDVSLGGIGITCSPRDPRFAGSNPAEVDGFFQDVKTLSISPPGGTLSHPPNIVRVNKSKRMRWAGHVARMEEGRNAFKILTGKPTGKDL